MRVLNSVTRRDVTRDYIRLLEGKITNAEFEVIAGVSESTRLTRLSIDNINVTNK